MRRSTSPKLIKLVSCLFYAHLVFGCGSKKGDGGEKNPPTGPGSAVKNMLGDGVTISPDDNSGYDGKNGQAGSAADLNCDFSAPCCWKNSKPPYDTMDWAKGSGNVDPDKFQKNFGTSSTPSGNFLLTSSDTKAGPADKAEYQSCLIPCAGDSIKVSLNHWASSPTKIQVCEVAQSDPNTLLGCQDLPASGPGPDTVTLPPGQNVYIAIIAYNLVADGGNMAIIQNIKVDYPPCGSSPAPTTGGVTTGPVTPGSTPPAGPDIGECKKIASDFEQGLGNYGPGSGNGKIPWQQAGPDRYKNPATGVAKSPDNSHYSATYLKPGEDAYMESAGNFFTDSDKQIKFQEYKATEGIDLKACCDTVQGCNYDTGKKVEKTDFRQWYQGSVTCKQGTQKVIFYAQNQGSNEGGVGIDNVQVFDATGNTQLC